MRKLGLFFCFSLLACSPAPDKKDFVDTPVHSGPVGDLLSLEFPSGDISSSFDLKSHLEQGLLSTSDYFNSVNNLLSLADTGLNFSRELKDLGVQLLFAFYENQENFSKVCLLDSSYIDAAIGIYKQSLLKNSDKAFASALEETKGLLNQLKPEIEEDQKDKIDPKEKLKLVISYLESLPQVFVAKQMSPTIVEEMDKQLKVYVPILKEMLKDLYKLQIITLKEEQKRLLEDLEEGDELPFLLPEKIPLVESLIKKIVSLGIIPAEVQVDLESALSLPRKIANKLKREADAKDVTWVLTEIYKYYKAKYPDLKGKALSKKLDEDLPESMDSVATIYSGLDDFDLLWIQSRLSEEDEELALKDKPGRKDKLGRKDRILQWLKDRDHKKILENRSFILVNTVRAYGFWNNYRNIMLDIDRSVSMALIMQLDKEILKIYLRINEVIGSILYQQITAIGDGWYNRFEENILGTASEVLRSKIFQNRNFFPGLEFQNFSIKAFHSNVISSSLLNKNFSEECTNDISSVTNAKTIGSALKANIRFLNNYEKLTLRSNPYEYNTMAFSAVNKLLAMGGYTNAKGTLSSALFRPIRNYSFYNPDIYLYEEQKGSYAIPDSLKIREGYKIIEAPMEKYHVDMLGQAEVLMATSMAINLFDNTNRNVFNRYIGALSFMDISVFPKSPFYDLSLGVSAMILRNLQREGLYLFGEDQSIIDISAVEDLTKLGAKVAGVAIADYGVNGTTKKVEAKDMFKFSLALANFIKVTDKAIYNAGSVLNFMNDGKRVDFDNVIKARDILKKMVVGINNFILSRHQSENLKIMKSYSLNENAPSIEEADLETYLNAIRSLLSAYKQYKGKVYLWAAVDIYNLLNQQFYNAELGVYLDFNQKLKLKDLSLSIVSLEELKATLNGLKENEKIWWEKRQSKQLDKLIHFHIQQVLQ